MNGIAKQIATQAGGGDEKRCPGRESDLIAFEERGHVREQNVVAGTIHQGDEQGEDHGATVLGSGECFLERIARQTAGFLEPLEVRGIGDRAADVPADDSHRNGHEERDAPRPRCESAAVDRVGVEPRRHGKRDHRSGQQCEERRDLRVARDQAALAFRGVFGEERHGAGSFTTDGESLHDPQKDQQCRCRDTDGRVGGQQADTGGRHADQHDDEHQHLLSTDPVAEDAADHRAEGSNEERDRVAGEHQHQRVARLRYVEEHDGQCRRHEREDTVVVELDEDADAARCDDFPDLARVGYLAVYRFDGVGHAVSKIDARRGALAGRVVPTWLGTRASEV